MNKFILLIFLIVSVLLYGCKGNMDSKSTEKINAKTERVVIYSSAESYRNEYFVKKLKEKFPNYEIIYEYLPTGEHAAKLKAEGSATECDITFDLEYAYLDMLKDNLAVLDNYDFAYYADDVISSAKQYLPENKLSGAVIVNNKLLRKLNLPMPHNYDDLLRPEYKNLIVMPNPRLSGTGYIFLKSMINARGEDAAFRYFDKLNENILYYTSSGSGPINSLLMEEAAIGLGMTAQAVLAVNKGADFSILFFPEGAPYTCYGTAIIKGRENRPAVREVFAYINDVLIEDNNRLFFPERIYRDKIYSMPNYPQNIKYADMSGNTIDEKLRILEKWSY